MSFMVGSLGKSTFEFFNVQIWVQSNTKLEWMKARIMIFKKYISYTYVLSKLQSDSKKMAGPLLIRLLLTHYIQCQTQMSIFTWLYLYFLNDIPIFPQNN